MTESINKLLQILYVAPRTNFVERDYTPYFVNITRTFYNSCEYIIFLNKIYKFDIKFNYGFNIDYMIGELERGIDSKFQYSTLLEPKFKKMGKTITIIIDKDIILSNEKNSINRIDNNMFINYKKLEKFPITDKKLKPNKKFIEIEKNIKDIILKLDKLIMDDDDFKYEIIYHI